VRGILVAAVVLLAPGCGGSVWGPVGDDDDSEATGTSPPLEQVPGAERAWCDPVAEAGDPNYLEGETVALAFSCSSGVGLTGFTAELTTDRVGVVFHEDDWTVSWTTGFADGGRHELVLEVWPAGEEAAGALPETAVATVWVADAHDHPDNVPPIPSEYTEEWGLPVVHLQTHGPLTQEHVATTVTFMGHTYTAEMKIRGAVSVNYPKNSYTVRFGDEDLDADALGMGNKDHLVLITPFDDNSYVRQKLAYDLWIAMADHWGADRMTPRTAFVVAYLDGGYWGLYTACDRIDDHFAEEMGLSRDGNLYKAINHDANFYRHDSGGNTKSTLHQGYTKEEGAPDVYTDLDALVAHSADSDHATFVDGAGDWIRTDEFMDWFLFAHHTASDDSAGKNAYLYSDPANPEFRYVPWDFNHSYGQGWYTYRVDSNTYSDFTWNNGIFAHFHAHDLASGELWDRYSDMRTAGPLHLDWFFTQLDGYYDLIQPSAVRDWAAWGPDYLSYWAGSNANDYEAEKAYLYGWLEDRDEYMGQVHP
jgi:spore coat protein H